MDAAQTQKRLPWPLGLFPLMLAPMQGLTNKAFRALLIDWVRPDVVFTELMRVSSASASGCLARADRNQIAGTENGVPLVVQLIGSNQQALVAAAETAQAAGAEHLNLNMGCPFGRMSTSPMGGGMLRAQRELDRTLPALRQAVSGSFSLKLRSGYEDPEQIFSLLPLFEDVGVDFLILHPRTVVQKYGGRADHDLTAEVVKRTRLPVIANGDIMTAEQGMQVRQATGSAGLMLGRGAVNDPLLFQRLRGEAPPDLDPGERIASLRHYLQALLTRYNQLFSGNTQVLAKMKEVIAHINEPYLKKEMKALKKSQKISTFSGILATLDQ